MDNVRIVCINDKDRPQEIPLNKWPKKDEWYTMTHLYYHPVQLVQGIDIAEMELGPEEYPYGTYKLSRFAVHKDDLEKLKQMVEDCNNLNDVDINKLLEESNVETHEEIEYENMVNVIREGKLVPKRTYHIKTEDFYSPYNETPE